MKIKGKKVEGLAFSKDPRDRRVYYELSDGSKVLPTKLQIRQFEQELIEQYKRCQE